MTDAKLDSMLASGRCLVQEEPPTAHTNVWSHFYAPDTPDGKLGPWECESLSYPSTQRFSHRCRGTVHGLWLAGFALRRINAKTGHAEAAGTVLFPPGEHFFKTSLLFILPSRVLDGPAVTADPPRGRYSVDVVLTAFAHATHPQGQVLGPGLHLVSEQTLEQLVSSKDYRPLPELKATASLLFDEQPVTGERGYFSDKSDGTHATTLQNVFVFSTSGTVEGGWPGSVLLFVRTPGNPDLVDIVALPAGRLQTKVYVAAILGGDT